MNVLVTGGGTTAPIDDVRHITNSSTGRFSAMLTEACLEQGAEVWHVHTPSALKPFHRLAHFELESNAELEFGRLFALQKTWRRHRKRLHLEELPTGTVTEYASAVERILRSQPIDVAILAMAVSDYEPLARPGKLSSSLDQLTIHCRPTEKVIRRVRDWAPEVYLLGFKLTSNASHDDLIAAAARSCEASRADAVAANDLATVQADLHVVHLVRPGHPVETFGPGDDLARNLVDRVLTLARDRIAGLGAIPFDEELPT